MIGLIKKIKNHLSVIEKKKSAKNFLASRRNRTSIFWSNETRALGIVEPSETGQHRMSNIFCIVLHSHTNRYTNMCRDITAAWQYCGRGEFACRVITSRTERSNKIGERVMEDYTLMDMYRDRCNRKSNRMMGTISGRRDRFPIRDYASPFTAALSFLSRLPRDTFHQYHAISFTAEAMPS